MNIDPFTLVCQIINFIILVVLLRRFLYRPIVKAMDEREAKIAGRLKEAEARRLEAEQEAEAFRTRTQDLADRRDEMIAQAEKEADERRKELLEQARDEIHASKARWDEAVQQQRQSFMEELRRRTVDEVFSIARRALGDLAGEDIERRMIDTFLEHLQQLDETQQAQIEESLRQGHSEMVARCSVEPDEPTRNKVAEAVRARFGDSVEVRFEAAPELICGIELNANDRKIAWNLEDYLDNIEQQMAEVLDQNVASTPETPEEAKHEQ